MMRGWVIFILEPAPFTWRSTIATLFTWSEFDAHVTSLLSQCHSILRCKRYRHNSADIRPPLHARLDEFPLARLVSITYSAITNSSCRLHLYVSQLQHQRIWCKKLSKHCLCCSFTGIPSTRLCTKFSSDLFSGQSFHVNESSQN